MATEKDSIQKERIQSVTAVPRTESAAPSTGIPRRGLLTGAALVLAGTAAAASGCCWSRQKPLRTKFMQDFTAMFIGDPTKIKDPGEQDTWPDPGRKWPAPATELDPQIKDDFETFVDILMKVGFLLAPPPTTYAPGTLGDQIVQFINTNNWPTTTTVLPPYDTANIPLPTVHLIEISVILDRLLQANNSFHPPKTSGGGGSSWPPH